MRETMRESAKVNYSVVTKHRTEYPNPLVLLKGQSIFIGEKYSGPEEWDNWYYCTTLDHKHGGWVPGQLIDVIEAQGVILEDYTAKELDVNEGEQVVGTKELNGWIWCVNTLNSEEGWVPKENLKP
ncbi:SH3 domain-containing protein [Paenibacillus sp. SC116]|uniref:SH3 domain-containing protein n=1 Tax=Paenibacillus sp. SC116 TaxID=2968986 RepID=UPI00215B3D1A|nr:SH3 domain-containing protein [Paenibacillus sp. SC116]MCR8843984.1 SH3 domain-containing protein [Paenibacillus sp. SC116]